MALQIQPFLNINSELTVFSMISRAILNEVQAELETGEKVNTKSKQNKILNLSCGSRMAKKRNLSDIIEEEKTNFDNHTQRENEPSIQVPNFGIREVSGSINIRTDHGKRCRFRTTGEFSLIYMTLKCQQDTLKEIFSS